MSNQIILIIIKSWSGTLEQTHEEGMRNHPDIAEAMFCEDNQYLAAQVVFQVSTFPPPPDLTKKEAIEIAKTIVKGN